MNSKDPEKLLQKYPPAKPSDDKALRAKALNAANAELKKPRFLSYSKRTYAISALAAVLVLALAAAMALPSMFESRGAAPAGGAEHQSVLVSPEMLIPYKTAIVYPSQWPAGDAVGALGLGAGSPTGGYVGTKMRRLAEESKRVADRAAQNPGPRPAMTLVPGTNLPLSVVPDNEEEVPAETEPQPAIIENPFVSVGKEPLSTFSIDVDTASYTLVRRSLREGVKPQPGDVRIEEMINYFRYDYPNPTGDDPFSLTCESGPCPWNEAHRLILVGLKGRDVDLDKAPASNLVFLLDVSGSMSDADKLPLIKDAFKLLVPQLRDKDRVAIVVYAGAAGVVLPSTMGSDKKTILEAVDKLSSGGSTAGAEGLLLAYKVASENFIKGGNNRIILGTDGDFNVGISSDDELVKLIEAKRAEGIFLSIVGVGAGNYKDQKMEQIADHGNGIYAYLDSLDEARRVLVTQMAGTVFTIAKDVKLQLEFNPRRVAQYRLIGYENRMLAAEDFANDAKDAGELGSGHMVTALYEIIPSAGNEPPAEYVKPKDGADFGPVELMEVNLRYKLPAADKSTLMTEPAQMRDLSIEETSDNFRFASAVAAFGLLLRNSAYKGTATTDLVNALSRSALGADGEGYRAEFLDLVRIFSALK
ncbi:MAG: VWA domain-containing protein [Candidatus Brocadiia bacterium]